jgi:hypothetical protein
MNYLKTIAGNGVVLALTFTASVAWGQSVPRYTTASGAIGDRHDTASLMEQNISREIKQAWSDGKNATLAMSFQENGEIAMDEGKEEQARRYFRAAEQELRSLKPEHASYTSYTSFNSYE